MIWRLVTWVVMRPTINRWLCNYRRLPYGHIGNYMHRYWLMPRWALGWNPDSLRLEPKPWVPFAIRINHIKRADKDPYIHDHPWDWRTIIIDGWYLEMDSTGTWHDRVAGDTNTRKAHDPHRISLVRPCDGAITLFITFRKYNSWGFYVGNPARKVPYKQYHSENGRDA